MHRQPLLEQLADYATRHPEEAATVARFIAFVRSETACFERSLAPGHLTGSAWIVNADGRETLLTHHRKLDRWLQLGGHADGDPDIFSVALKEAREESGLEHFEPLVDGIFDLDIHLIPARGKDPEHLHYDVRYLLRATGGTDYTVSDESHDLRWVGLDEVAALTREESMSRMVSKSRRQLDRWRASLAERLPS